MARECFEAGLPSSSNLTSRHSGSQSEQESTVQSKPSAASTSTSNVRRDLRSDRSGRRRQDFDLSDSRRRHAGNRGRSHHAGQSAREARSYVGYLTQVFSLYHDLTVAENLRYMGELRRLPDDEIERRGRRYLEMFGMDRFTNRLAGRLSGGMKQKLSLACALIIEPKILLLDEPTTGVDPVSRREFWDALADLSDQGITIVIATPYLDEAERCTRVALMHEGRIHQTGTPRELRDHLGLQRLVVRTSELEPGGRSSG